MRGLQPWVVSLVGASLLVLASRSGLACSEPSPDPWFVAHLQIDGAALPPDILLSGRPPLGIMIQNESASTLQVEVPAGAGWMRRISVEPGGNQTASLAATGFVASARGLAACETVYERILDGDSDAPAVWAEPAKPRNL
jgi:hypothetical protein